MKHTQLALAVGLAVAVPAVVYTSPVYAQAAKTVVSSTVRTQTAVTVLSSGTPTITTSIQYNTVTRTLADGSVIKETTPITYTITRTPQTIRTDTIQVTTTIYSDKTTGISRQTLSSVIGTRVNQTQSGVRGAVQTVVVSGPTRSTTTSTTTTTSTAFDARPNYNDPNVGTPSIVPSTIPGYYRNTEFTNKVNNLINADAAYARGWTGRGSTVLIMDTGVNAAHPDLAGKIKYTRDFTATSISDTNGHGTHVAGIVAANRDGAGMHGVAFDANLAIAKIGTGPSINIGASSAAMAWASQYSDVVVANLSASVVYNSNYTAYSQQVSPGMWINTHQHYGGKNYYNLETPQGMVIPTNMVLTVAAGNSNLGYVQNPATFAVATDANGNLVHGGRMLVVGNWNAGLGVVEGAKAGHMCKDYVNNTCNDRYRTSDFYILAPGSGVYSTSNTGSYSTMSGTSQAAPAVAGAIAIVNQLWPYMTPANQVQLLLKTANKDLPKYDVNVHGQGLLDLDKATRPVGGLGISTTGRTGIAQPISGMSIAGTTGAISAQVSSVSTVDSFQRDFTVNLSPAVQQRGLVTHPMMLRHEPGQSWSGRLAQVYSYQFAGYSLGQMGQNVTLSLDSRAFGNYSPGQHQITLTRTNQNPWVNYSGAWGTVQYSTTMEYNYTWRERTEGFWAQGGAMQTTSQTSEGMVQKLAPIYAVHGVVGYTTKSINMFAGVQPYVVSGHMDLRVPTMTDAAGTMYYTGSRVRIQDPGPVGYAGVNYRQALNKIESISYSAVANQMGSRSVDIRYTRTF